MRNNKHFAMCDSPIQPKLNQQALMTSVERFIAKGGNVTQVPTGVSGYEPLSVVKKNKGKQHFEPGAL